ncbi:hypothetical protein ACOKFD_00700 [Flagellimonas sp. S174]|uniref:hypothetical protein n=1 Tax=Flagellimonas sp. S174 TaxID=3410790 RepID=UPI003BF4C2DB
MIKLFSKIRMQLISENKFRNYLVYAIGEIVLVVIGILIAIQINSFNESKKTDEKRENLKERLGEQINLNQFQVKESIQDLENQIEGIKSVMNLMGDSGSLIESSSVNSLMTFVIEDHHLGLDMTTLQEALQNGELSVLKNNNLRTSLYSLLKYNERLEQREEIANYDNNNFNIPFLYKNVNSRNISANTNMEYKTEIGYSKLESNDFKSLFGNREFENLVESRFYYAKEMMTNYRRMEKFLDYLDGILENKK